MVGYMTDIIFFLFRCILLAQSYTSRMIRYIVMSVVNTYSYLTT